MPRTGGPTGNGHGDPFDVTTTTFETTEPPAPEPDPVAGMTFSRVLAEAASRLWAYAEDDEAPRCRELGNVMHAKSRELAAWDLQARVDQASTDWFWAARPELATIRDFAWAKFGSPWAHLAAVLGRAATATPWQVCLPGLASGRVSLGLFTALVAPPGGGKGNAFRGARELLPVEITSVGLGSGEGINRMYRRRGRAPAPDQIAPLEWIDHCVLFEVEEVETEPSRPGMSWHELLAREAGEPDERGE